jgi:hypothetical protein
MVVWKAFPGGTFTVQADEDCWIKLKRWAVDDCEIFGTGGPTEVVFPARRLKSTPDIISSIRVLIDNQERHIKDWSSVSDQDDWALNYRVSDFSVIRVEYSTDEPETNVWGYFNDVNTSVPVQGVKVTIGSISTFSDANGYFSLSGLFGPEFDIVAEHPNYATEYIHPVNVTNYNFNWSQVMTPSAGVPVDPGITITGQVLDEQSSMPLVEALVTWGSQQTTTDSSGRYTLTDVIPGVEWLTAEAVNKKTKAVPLSTPYDGTVTHDFLLPPDEIGVVKKEEEFPNVPKTTWDVTSKNIWNMIQLSFPTSMSISAPYIGDTLYRFITGTDPITNQPVSTTARDFNEFQGIMALELGTFLAGGLAAKATVGLIRGAAVPWSVGASDFMYHNFNTGGITAVSGFMGWLDLHALLNMECYRGLVLHTIND